MNILVVYPDLKVGGVQHMTVTLANAWAAAGHKVTLVIGLREPSLEPYSLLPQVEIIDLAAQRVRQYLLRLAMLLRRQGADYDVLYTATTVPNIAAVLARLLTRVKIPLVLSERDNPQQGFAALPSIYDRSIWRLKPWAYSRAEAVVCVSTPLADALATFTGMPRERIDVIHNPAAPPHNEFLTASPPHPWLADPTVPVIVAAGRFHPQKDFPMLVRAFARLRARRPARLILLGDGEERRSIEGTITAMGVEADVFLPGMQKDILPWLVHADVFAMSSLFEGFGNVLVQALAAGAPIVSTDCPDGPSEILENGRWGELSPVGDEAAFAEAVERTLSRVHDREKLRSRARAFSIDKTAKRYLALFESVS